MVLCFYFYLFFYWGYTIPDISAETYSLREDQNFYNWNAKGKKESKLKF